MKLKPITITTNVAKAELYIIEDSRGLRWGYVVNVEVIPEERRKGYGREIMRKAEDVARDNGCKFIKLTTRFSNKEARSFYQGLNYWEAVAFGKDL